MLKIFIRKDHEGRIVPYLLAGLFDPLELMQKLVFREFEEIGKVYEEENVNYIINFNIIYLKIGERFTRI